MTSPRLEKLDEIQQRQLIMPRGSLKLADGRVLQPIIGYDMRKPPPSVPKHIYQAVFNKITVESIIDSKGWMYQPTRLIVSASLDRSERWGVLMHVSMSYPDHDPTWDEIKMVRALFFPKEVDAIMVLPKSGDYVNVHHYCYHLWQAPQAWDMI